jgi:hypothetical protein
LFRLESNIFRVKRNDDPRLVVVAARARIRITPETRA